MKKYEGIHERSIDRMEEVRSMFRGLTPFDPGDKIDRLMQGAIDIHYHGRPSTYAGGARSTLHSEIEYAIEGTKIGMRAVVNKGVNYATARSATLAKGVVNQWAEEHNKKPCQVLGGVTLCYNVGGLNVDAVINAAEFGGKFVWTPVGDSSHHRLLEGSQETKGHGIDVLDDSDEVVPELKEIFKVVVEYDMVLNLCHHSTRERLILADTAKEMGVKRILIDHVFMPSAALDIDQMKMFADKGCYIEHLFYDLSPGVWPWDETLQAIKEVGADHFVIGSDLGSWRRPDGVTNYKITIGGLLERGIPEADVKKMVSLNAEKLIWGEP